MASNWFVETLRHHPEMALFLTLALGYLIGRLRVGGVTLGAVVGVLIAGVVIGQLGVKVSNDLKTAFFLLFLFSIGYRTGPQFFSGLRASGGPQLALTAIFAGTALAVGYALARAFGYDAGTAAGLIAGGVTESATVGTATDAINRLAIDAPAKQQLISNLAVAFAVTYFLGVVTTLTFLSRVAPRILGVDLQAECKALEKEMGVIGEEHAASAYRSFLVRAYRVESGDWAGRTVGEIERAQIEKRRRMMIVRLRRGEELLEATPDLRLTRGDTIVLAGRRAFVVDDGIAVGPEMDDKVLLDFPVETLEVVVTSKEVAGRSIGELMDRDAEDLARGVGLRGITRAGVELPWTLKTVVSRGDVVTLVGLPRDLERVAARLGYADRPGSVTDMVAVGAAVFLGGMIGIPALLIGKLEIGLSQSVGVLLGGLVLGWLRSIDRRFPRLPEAALWLFDSVGLTAFLAVTALAAGPDFVQGLQKSGVSLVIAGLAMVLVPQLVTLLAGRFIFRMHPGILLGVCCGAGTSAPSLAAVQEAAKSKIPTLGYGVTYAVGNVLLALWGTVIILLMNTP
ncbi:MAG TPA: aspartate-alanine antiporter [Burkholderiales bacterium]|nr:aspartate-alanine antiporter [Burkholderiales bacterium]